jgi:hypothetical protein
MKIQLTEEQIKQIRNDSWVDIDFDDGMWLHFEFNDDMTFSYGEIKNPLPTNGRIRAFAFDEKDLKKLVPAKPYDPNWHHDWPTCPTCGTYMIYNFECCPKCGQTLLWKEFTGDR